MRSWWARSAGPPAPPPVSGGDDVVDAFAGFSNRGYDFPAAVGSGHAAVGSGHVVGDDSEETTDDEKSLCHIMALFFVAK